MDIELEKAIRTVKIAGYAVIKPEMIRTMQSETSVSLLDFIRHGDQPGFMNAIRRDLAATFADLIRRDNMMEVTVGEGDAREPGRKFYKATITVFDPKAEVDPILSFIRQEQRG